jgi:hypothetical protein
VPKISLQKNNIPFLFGGVGKLSVDSANLQLNQPLDPLRIDAAQTGFRYWR